MKYPHIQRNISNRGIAPDSFIDELIQWGRTASEDIFDPRDVPVGKPDPDIYAQVKPELGPWTGLLHRKAVMLEVMLVLAGFESSWNWKEGVDTTSAASLAHIMGQETGAWQVSFDSLGFGEDLKRLVQWNQCTIPERFIPAMKTNHPFAIEYAARLLRHTNRHNGPVLRKEINPWLSRESVAEFERRLGVSTEQPMPSEYVPDAGEDGVVDDPTPASEQRATPDTDQNVNEYEWQRSASYRDVVNRSRSIERQRDSLLERVAALEADKARLDEVESNCWDVRCYNIPIGGGDDADIGWEVIEHHMSKPHERQIALGKTPRAAIDSATKGER